MREPILKELHLQNILSFGPDTKPIPLGPLNVLIGPNGSGKSNLLEAISLLRAAPRDLSAPVKEAGGVRDWLWKGTKILQLLSRRLLRTRIVRRCPPDTVFHLWSMAGDLK